MRGYIWRIAFESGEIKEVTAPTIMAAILLAAPVWRQNKIVSAIRLEEAPEEIPVSMIGVVTA